MPSAAELQVVVNADVSPAESKLSSFGSGLGSALGLGVAAAGAAIAAGVAVGVKAAGDLEQSVANISTIKPEIDTSAVFASLSEMSTRIPQTASQLGESLYNVFSSVNVSAEQGLQLVETFAKGAVGAGTSAETFGTAAMGVMNAYGLSVADASHISDVFFNTVNAGVVTGEELASSLGPVTQSAKAAGVSLDELGAMIVGVTKEGGPAAQNINNLNNLLQKVTTKEAQKGMNDLGVATKTATGDFRPTIDVMRDLKTHLAGMTESARAAALQTIFPDAQARIGALTIMSQIDAVDAALETNKTAVGSTASAYEKMSATFNSQSKLLQNGLMAVLTTVGAMLLPLITPLVTAFATALPGAFQSAMTALVPFGAMLMSLGPTIAAAVQIASDAWGTLQQVFAGEWAPDASIQPFVNALGMVAIVVRDQVLPAISALLAIDYSILSTVGAFIISQFQVVVAWFVANWPLILQTIQTVGDAITAFWGAWGGTIVTVIQAAWTMVTTVISTALAVILGLVTAAMQAINGDWSGAWATLATVAQTAMTGMQTILQAAWDAVVAVVTTALALLQPIVETTWTAITTAIQTAMTTVQETVRTAWTTITTAIQTALTTVGTVIQTAWGAITSQVSTAMLAIQTAIKAVWDLIPADIQADLLLITGFLLAAGVEWLTSLTTSTAAMLLAITTWATNTLTAITTWITTTVAAITAWATEFLAPITALIGTSTTAATAIGDGILTSIQAKVAEALTAVTTFATGVLAALQGLVGTAGAAAAAIGSAIISGISGGIQAGAASVAAAAAATVRAALQAAKSAIGAESPSTVFRDEVGKMIPDGIAAGVEQSGPSIMEATVAAIVTALDAARVAIEGLTAKIGQLLSAMAGQVGAAFTGMTTAVTTETATMAAAVTEQAVQLGTRLIEATTNAAGITVERYREMSGEIVTIVTGQNGAVLADFTTKASEIGLVTDTLGTKLISSTTSALGQTTEVYREKSGEIVTLVIGAGGEIVAEYTATATAAVAKSTEMKSGVVKQFAETAAGAVKATESFDTFKGSLASIKPPDLSSTVKQFDSVTKAAEKAADAIKDINQASKGGSSGGNSGLGKGKASGGPVSFGTVYPVGERGPELFAPWTNGTIIPNHALGGGGTTIVVNLNIEGSVQSERALVEAVRAGLIEVGRRNGGTASLFGDT